MVQRGNCNPNDHGGEEAEFPFHFAYQAEHNFRNIAQKMLPRKTSKMGKTKENDVWESCSCDRENTALGNSLCKYIFQHFTVQVKVREILLQ